MPEFGVIVPSDLTETALAAGADYVEPTIVDSVVIEGPDGRWVARPDYPGPDRAMSFAILVPGGLRLSDPSFDRAAVSEYLATALAAVGMVAGHNAKIVFGSGAARTIPDGVNRDAGHARFAEVLREARDIATGNDLRIVLEPLHAGETNLINTVAEAVEFLDRHDIERVDVVADLFHIMRESEPLAVVTQHGARIGHAHIADSERAAPGQGDWPLKEFLDALEAGGYAGSVSIEVHWKDLETELPAALAHLRAL